ncbi:hypothetical protein I302_105230 [Kwoniella bestiolae CBS 10118]|uniref:Uncharacterized protein n=1 Tax=Kwoniella bestiolae CBS 10118 TaxID=1296100 RepID=A0A1B9FSL0_9TREE|nr:hypothetical protein I302_08518 [Kwoniella bestiolae CBS 10118]OCF21740.1 hypothetical protein I302_08518 [Kwoniella bestiolae CBS 10118]
MAHPIPTTNKPRQLSLSNAHIDSNSALLTPNGTPPHTAHGHDHTHFNSRLQQLLSNFESGTHSFDRDERESPEERRMSFGNGSDVFPTPPSSRRPSFLSSLSLSRPFAFTPTASSSPISSSHQKDQTFANLQMTSSARPNLERENQIQSSPNLVGHYEKEEGNLPKQLNRSKTTPHIGGNTSTTQKQSGFEPIHKSKSDLGHGSANGGGGVGEKRHFDPSREPKLLGLL